MLTLIWLLGVLAAQMPITSAYPGPLSVLIMDNARIHHGDEILVLADRFGEYQSVSSNICTQP